MIANYMIFDIYIYVRIMLIDALISVREKLTDI